jgi:hypothetical protein
MIARKSHGGFMREAMLLVTISLIAVWAAGAVEAPITKNPALGYFIQLHQDSPRASCGPGYGAWRHGSAVGR